MSDAPQANEAGARTETGELKDQSLTQANPDTTTQATETKLEIASTETKPEVKAETKEGDKTSVVPEKYEFKAPEGTTLDETTITEASAVFKELGLSNEAAQKLVDLNAKLAKTVSEAPYKAYDAMREGWQNETKADKEIGHILPKVKETIGKALDTIADPALVAEFKNTMNLTGSGDHPAFIKTFYKLAQSIVEGSHVSGKGPSPHGQSATGTTERPSVANAMYPNLK